MGPLSGVKVLEIGGIGPGPFAAMMLADMGAEVIRLDRAAGGLGSRLARYTQPRPAARWRCDLKQPAGR